MPGGALNVLQPVVVTTCTNELYNVCIISRMECVYQGRHEVCAGIRDQRGGIRDQKVKDGIWDHSPGIRNLH